MLVDKGMKLALRHHRIGKVQTVELYLPWAVIIQGILGSAVILLKVVDELIVERTVRHKLQRANGVGHTLEIVALSVREVIHWIAMPLCASAMMRCLNDAIHHRVTEVHVGVGHVHLGPKHHRAFHGLCGVHLVEEF